MQESDVVAHYFSLWRNCRAMRCLAGYIYLMKKFYSPHERSDVRDYRRRMSLRASGLRRQRKLEQKHHRARSSPRMIVSESTQ
jgi:hypothetical protein